MSLEQLESTPRHDLPDSVIILGVRVDRFSQYQAINRIEQLVEERRASQGQIPCQQVVTVNPEFVMAAQKHTEFRQAINTATLSLPDGAGVVWATRYKKQPAPERVTGTDLLPPLAERCAAKGYRLYLLGAASGIAEAAADKLRQNYPNLQIAGTYAGSPAPAEENEIIERISAARADMLCVAYGAPAQELWIYRNLHRLPTAVAIGVGGAFDFISGHQRRAPKFFQKSGLEWLYRLYREPWRWRRMLALPLFAVKVALKGRKN
ncbi:MAG TPA: WecB/TagA/CpsF family glycosyltransferase [Ktedonobacteraceae bacterium]|nr:WecB/TagA/CpsF family glycosyltransferase [Ktedonobacteraceae bacterium]